MGNQESPPLDPSLAPALLFDGAEAGEEAETTDNGGTTFLYSIPKRRLLRVSSGFDYLNSDVTWITPQGWVLVLDPSTREASLRAPFTSCTVRLPSDNESLLPSNEHTRCLLSTDRPTDDPAGGCIVLVIHLEDPVLWYCSPGGSRWLRHAYPSELITSDRCNFTSVMAILTAVRGKFYSRSFFGSEHERRLVTLEFSPGPVFSSTLVVITPWLSGFSRVCLIESCGDLFLLRFSLEPFCGEGITEIYVYKLVLSNNAWVKVAALGDNRVFFSAGTDSFSMAADEVGLKANCIYYTRDNDKGLYVYDLEQGTTTLHNPGLDVPDPMEPVLLMPAQASI